MSAVSDDAAAASRLHSEVDRSMRRRFSDVEATSLIVYGESRGDRSHTPLGVLKYL